MNNTLSLYMKSIITQVVLYPGQAFSATFHDQGQLEADYFKRNAKKVLPDTLYPFLVNTSVYPLSTRCAFSQDLTPNP